MVPGTGQKGGIWYGMEGWYGLVVRGWPVFPKCVQVKKRFFENVPIKFIAVHVLEGGRVAGLPKICRTKKNNY